MGTRGECLLGFLLLFVPKCTREQRAGISKLFLSEKLPDGPRNSGMLPDVVVLFLPTVGGEREVEVGVLVAVLMIPVLVAVLIIAVLVAVQMGTDRGWAWVK